MTQATLQLSVVERGTGRCICNFASQLDTARAVTHQAFEEEAWRRAVRACLVTQTDRLRYAVELSIAPRYGLV